MIMNTTCKLGNTGFKIDLINDINDVTPFRVGAATLNTSEHKGIGYVVERYYPKPGVGPSFSWTYSKRDEYHTSEEGSMIEEHLNTLFNQRIYERSSNHVGGLRFLSGPALRYLSGGCSFGNDTKRVDHYHHGSVAFSTDLDYYPWFEFDDVSIMLKHSGSFLSNDCVIEYHGLRYYTIIGMDGKRKVTCSDAAKQHHFFNLLRKLIDQLEFANAVNEASMKRVGDFEGPFGNIFGLYEINYSAMYIDLCRHDNHTFTHNGKAYTYMSDIECTASAIAIL